jgi:hypothetical protein
MGDNTGILSDVQQDATVHYNPSLNLLKLRPQPKGKKKFGKNSEMMEGYCLVISVIGLSRHAT